jgi:DNA-binding HxlR family transcriptional regulator
MVTIGDRIDARPPVPAAEEGTSAKPRGDVFEPQCPTRNLLDRIGDKWTSMLIKVLADAARGPEPEVRFAELRRRAPGISKKMLASTLRSLEADGLVTRRVEPTVPPKVYYATTELGATLDEPLAALREWAEVNMPVIRDRRAAAAHAD